MTYFRTFLYLALVTAAPAFAQNEVGTTEATHEQAQAPSPSPRKNELEIFMRSLRGFGYLRGLGTHWKFGVWQGDKDGTQANRNGGDLDAGEYISEDRHYKMEMRGLQVQYFFSDQGFTKSGFFLSGMYGQGSISSSWDWSRYDRNRDPNVWDQLFGVDKTLKEKSSEKKDSRASLSQVFLNYQFHWNSPIAFNFADVLLTLGVGYQQYQFQDGLELRNARNEVHGLPEEDFDKFALAAGFSLAF